MNIHTNQGLWYSVQPSDYRLGCVMPDCGFELQTPPPLRSNSQHVFIYRIPYIYTQYCLYRMYFTVYILACRTGYFLISLTEQTHWIHYTGRKRDKFLRGKHNIKRTSATVYLSCFFFVLGMVRRIIDRNIGQINLDLLIIILNYCTYSV